jgi:hypothetical protein
MPRKPHREAFEESNRHLRVRVTVAALSVAVLVMAMEVVVAGESMQPGDLLIAGLISAVGGAGMAVLGLALGALTRWGTLPRSVCRPASLVMAGIGLAMSAQSIMATHQSARNPLGMAEDRHYPLLVAGLVLVAFGFANRPPRANLG